MIPKPLVISPTPGLRDHVARRCNCFGNRVVGTAALQLGLDVVHNARTTCNRRSSAFWRQCTSATAPTFATTRPISYSQVHSSSVTKPEQRHASRDRAGVPCPRAPTPTSSAPADEHRRGRVNDALIVPGIITGAYHLPGRNPPLRASRRYRERAIGEALSRPRAWTEPSPAWSLSAP